jgi:hypothetical protein
VTRDSFSHMFSLDLYTTLVRIVPNRTASLDSVSIHLWLVGI